MTEDNKKIDEKIEEQPVESQSIVDVERELMIKGFEEEAGRNAMAEELPDDIKEKLEKKKKENEKAKKRPGKKRKKKEKKTVKSGKAYVRATYNNTIVTLTDMQGNVLSWASAGIAGFKGPKKSTPYASQIITRIAVMKAKEEYGLSEVSVFVKGVGTGRESAVRALNANGLIITAIKDITPIPHNGCRPSRPRRV
jgi:small subunit ribosomal protein S11